MSNLNRWRRLSLQLVAISLLLTACFRDTTEVMQEQPVARQYVSPTAVQVVEHTEVPATETLKPAATEPLADQFALTATAIIARQTQPAADQQAPSDSVSADPAAGVEQATSVPVVRATIPPGEDCVHEIRAGETLFQLSLAYGVTVEAIADASEIIDVDRISVGQHVTIPQCGTTGFIPPPTSIPTATFEAVTTLPTIEASEIDFASGGDTRSELIEQAQEALLDNAQSDPLDDFSAQLAGEATPSRLYTVQQNDTLFEIAASFGTTVDVLAALNDIVDVDSLNAGVVLEIP